MNNKPTETKYDLEERTFQFAKGIRLWINSLPKSLTITEDSKQLIRSSGSIGANYIESNEALSKKDFSFRIKICVKEAKETVYWLRLLLETNNKVVEINDANMLLQEAIELKKIFAAISSKTGR